MVLGTEDRDRRTGLRQAVGVDESGVAERRESTFEDRLGHPCTAVGERPECRDVGGRAVEVVDDAGEHRGHHRHHGDPVADRPGDGCPLELGQQRDGATGVDLPDHDRQPPYMMERHGEQPDVVGTVTEMPLRSRCRGLQVGLGQPDPFRGPGAPGGEDHQVGLGGGVGLRSGAHHCGAATGNGGEQIEDGVGRQRRPDQDRMRLHPGGDTFHSLRVGPRSAVRGQEEPIRVDALQPFDHGPILPPYPPVRGL